MIDVANEMVRGAGSYGRKYCCFVVLLLDQLKRMIGRMLTLMFWLLMMVTSVARVVTHALARYSTF